MTDSLASVRALAETLVAQNRTLVTVESCTGGGIAASLTDLPGSSAWFERGFVTYSNAAKTDLVGVPAQKIQHHGAVSSEVAAAMAMGAVQRTPADCAMSVTGVAGPDGGSDEKPVGTVYIGWAVSTTESSEGISVSTERFLFDGDRESVRQQSIEAAIGGMVARLG